MSFGFWKVFRIFMRPHGVFLIHYHSEDVVKNFSE